MTKIRDTCLANISQMESKLNKTLSETRMEVDQKLTRQYMVNERIESFMGKLKDNLINRFCQTINLFVS